MYQVPYRAVNNDRDMEKAKVERMLKAGIVDPSSAEWASPVVFAQKMNDSWRFCMDYSKLNAVTVRDAYLIPRTDEFIDSLWDAQIFSILDANWGYEQVEVAEEDREKTTFTS